jgi:hypothetical protein
MIGRLEAARNRLETIEGTCREKGIDPEKIDEVIAQAEQVYQRRVQAIEKQTAAAEENLAPFLDIL